MIQGEPAVVCWRERGGADWRLERRARHAYEGQMVVAVIVAALLIVAWLAQ